ncbi:TonB C-terminal domain-containing protein [Sulfurovum sp.]|uniref:TonB C-terminal domain-containing protein n=1 Tax=Sulfurovum sp. TaxID=1969726 RepID=UPI002867FA7A|nr:TonB C-terminal domain-containing protein [Sulfurovum sp.]
MINKFSTFISGVLAVGIYIAFIVLLIMYFNTRDVKKPIHYVKKNEDRIRISLSSPKEKTKKQTKKPVIKKVVKKKPIPKKKSVKKETVKKKKVVKKKVLKEKVVKKPKKVKKRDTNTTRPKKVNKPKSLFDNIKTKKQPSKPKKKKVEKQKVTKPNVSASELFNDSIKVQKPSDRGIENAYLAMVEEKLNGWPAQSDYAGEKAKVLLKIQTNGSFTFKVITGSSNPEFNIGLKEYLKQLQRFGFGSHKGGRVYKIDVEFIATE